MKQCSVCKKEKANLVMEWRGVEFVKPLCVLCANKVVVELIRKDEGKVTT